MSPLSIFFRFNFETIYFRPGFNSIYLKWKFFNYLTFSGFFSKIPLFGFHSTDVASNFVKIRLSRNSTKFDWVTRFHETNSTVKSVSSSKI